MNQSQHTATTEAPRKWSSYQQRMFDWVAKETGSAVAIAVAGAGKTTTIVEIANRLGKHVKAIFVAFGKKIAQELSQRLPSHVPAKTMHGLGLMTWRYNMRCNPTIELHNKSWMILDELFPPSKDKTNDDEPDEVELFGAAAVALVSKAKGIGLVPAQARPTARGIVKDTDEAWLTLIDQYEIDLPEVDAAETRLLAMARRLLCVAIDKGREIVDSDDMLYLPVIFRCKFFKNDFVIVDECQDISPIQRAMLRMMLKPTGRLLAVGDPCQSIFAFRGADTRSVQAIMDEFNCVELELTVSYRCPKAVVRRVHERLGGKWARIQSAPGAIEGSVEEAYGAYMAFTAEQKKALFRSTDAIICRATKPLVKEAYSLIRASIPVQVLGRDIGAGLTSLIKKMRAKTISDLEKKLDKWLQRESAKFREKRQEDRVQGLEDKVETIKVFLEQLDEKTRTIPALLAKIEALFIEDEEKKDRLTLMTGHKSKGLEFERCFILNEHMCPSPYARTPEALEQENNLLYVMWTRSKNELWMIDNEPPRKREEPRDGVQSSFADSAARPKMVKPPLRSRR